MAATIALLRNPASGRGRGTSVWQSLEPHLERRVQDGSLRVIETIPGAITRQAAQAVQEGAHRVISAGGDGTLSQVAAGLLGSPASLGILPLGTGNDLARTLGIPLDPLEALEVALGTNVRRIDVGQWSGGVFLNVAGVGFDAVVAGRINRGFRFLRGTSAYVAAVLSTLFSYRPSQLRIRIDEGTWEGPAMLAAVANAQTYGGGMRIAPQAKVDDGLFDLVMIRAVTPWQFLRAFPSVFRGEHLAHPAVSVLRGREITLEASPPQPVLIDGESVGDTPLRLTILPQALNVAVPVRPGLGFSSPG